MIPWFGMKCHKKEEISCTTHTSDFFLIEFVFSIYQKSRRGAKEGCPRNSTAHWCVKDPVEGPLCVGRECKTALLLSLTYTSKIMYVYHKKKKKGRHSTFHENQICFLRNWKIEKQEKKKKTVVI